MEKARFPAFIAVIVATLIALTMTPVTATAQGLEGCPSKGVAPPPEYFLPNLWQFVVVSDERRDAEQLAATFADPADALVRLHAYCWTGQAERVYARDQMTVDVSIHDFRVPEGAALAQRWFGYQRAKELGLKGGGVKTREQLEEELGQENQVNIEALNNIIVNSYSNDNEYTIYARRGDIVTRVTVSGEPPVEGRTREFVAYQVLAKVFGLNLFNYPYSEP
jgi:hypothetical protein